MDPVIVDALQAIDASGVTVAQMDSTRPAPRGFWAEQFRTSTGPLRRGTGPVPDGYYLFRDGLIVGHHPGGSHTSADELARYLMSRSGAAREEQGWNHTRESYDRSRQEAPPPRTPPAPAPTDAYAVLGLQASCSDADIKSAYKAALKLNHPDRVAHLSPALQEFALAQTQAIREAFETLKADRGF